MGADPPGAPLARGPLRRYRAWLARSITNRATAVALGLALAVALVLGVTSYVTVHRLLTQRAAGVLEAHGRLMEQELRAALHAVVKDLEGLAANSLVANGLVDSAGRDTYLVPLLREHRVPGAQQAELVLCDFRGRPMATNRPALPAEDPDGPAGAAAAVPRAHLDRAGGRARLAMTFPVIFPPTGQPEGALVARVDLEPIFAAAGRAATGIDVALEIDGVTLARAQGRAAVIRHERRLALDGPLAPLAVRLTLGQDASAFAPVRTAALLYLAVGALALVAVSIAARGAARELTRRITRLSEAAREISAGTRAALPPARDPGDEVDTVTSAFGATLEKLRAIQDSLEQKVQERTAELSRREEELARSREQLVHAVQGSFLGVWSWDTATGAVTVSELWPTILGYTPGEIGATLAAWSRLLHPEDVDRVRGEVVAHLKGAAARIDTRYRMRAKDGAWRWIHSRGRAVERDASGWVTRVAGTHGDVTAVEDLHRRLYAATRLASVGTLAAGVAHEVNNPLSSVTANVEVALEALAAGAPLDAAGLAALRENLADAREGAARIARIVRSMRSLGAPERGAEARPANVRGELLDAIAMVHNQLVQRARLEVSVAEELPATRGRTSELGRVFLNLLVNAVQAIPEGAPDRNRISVAARTEREEVVVEIADTGEGIPPELRDRVFEAFFTTRPVGVGTGLGLSIALAIVESLGGRIELESEVGRGSTFRVRLPAGAGLDAPPPAQASAAPAEPGPRRRILVIDDDPLVRRAIARQLSERHEVTVLDSASEALRRIDAGEAWDAIVCDLMMTGTDGAAFHEAIAARHPALLGRIAFVTGGAFGERAGRFLAEHDVLVVAKPADRADLLEVVERLCARGAAPGAPARERRRTATSA